MFLPGFGTQSIHHYKNVALPDTLLWWPALWWYWRAFFGRRTSMGGKNSITFFQSSHPPNKCIFVLVKGAPNLSLQSGEKKKKPAVWHQKTQMVPSCCIFLWQSSWALHAGHTLTSKPDVAQLAGQMGIRCKTWNDGRLSQRKKSDQSF